MGRLTVALEALGKAGIRFEWDFWCCMSCGSFAMLDGFGKGENPELSRGFAFTHEQDVDRFAEDILNGTADVCLAWGAFGDGDGLAEGETIAGAFRDAGFPVIWNGSTDRRIMVQFDDRDTPDMDSLGWRTDWPADAPGDDVE